MGFSLTFMRFRREQEIDADREGLASWLARHRLTLDRRFDTACPILDPDGAPLQVDGRARDLHLDPLDSPGIVSGGIWHAGLGIEECTVIYDLCIAGRLLVMNPQAPDVFVVPGRTHRPEDVPGLADGVVGWADSPGELQAVLTDGYQGFLDYRDQVLGP